MTDQSAQLLYRIRVLPHQLARAREHYRQLLTEAQRYSLVDELTPADAAFLSPCSGPVPLGRNGAAAPAPSAAAPTLSAADQEGR